MEKQGFKSLLVWQKSYALTIKIYKVTEKFPKSEIYGLVSQMRRAAISVPANIAEGYERQYNKRIHPISYCRPRVIRRTRNLFVFSERLKIYH